MKNARRSSINLLQKHSFKMLLGVEYVVAAYLIWVFTFVFYIFITKRRMRISSQTIEAIKQRVSESSDNPDKMEDIENKD